MEKARTANSPANKALENVQRQIAQFQTESDILRTQFFNADGTQGAAARKPVEDKSKQLSRTKSRFLDSLKTADPMLWRMATLYVTPEYIAEKSSAASEVDFYTKNYFRNAELGDKGYDDIPDLYNSFEKFTTFLAQIATPAEKLTEAIDQSLAKIPAKSKAYRMALGGVITGLKTTNGQLCTVYTTKYIDLYRNNSLGEVTRLEYDIKKAGTFMPGFEAPDLAGMTPDSSRYSLKQMRGKIVMVDFWASWCGPCRRENPNVVANYNKYKDKGFDILGVSLDRDMTSWRKAIQQDGLPWRHISDLKGWQSEHAALYSVSSIPQTLLIDREGKIIARNLRGEQLGQKLKELFGE
ncbi:MAG: TlpA family protein disulfide reductase [Lewinellaceae bacterium]|nr:TlpA family protein disulfide reductase [Lewinellaceae bacterium]